MIKLCKNNHLAFLSSILQLISSHLLIIYCFSFWNLFSW